MNNRQAVADPGFPMGSVDPLGGRGPRHRHFSVKMYVKMKELGPVGGGVRPARPPPPDPPMTRKINMITGTAIILPGKSISILEIIKFNNLGVCFQWVDKLQEIYLEKTQTENESTPFFRYFFYSKDKAVYFPGEVTFYLTHLNV